MLLPHMWGYPLHMASLMGIERTKGDPFDPTVRAARMGIGNRMNKGMLVHTHSLHPCPHPQRHDEIVVDHYSTIWATPSWTAMTTATVRHRSATTIDLVIRALVKGTGEAPNALDERALRNAPSRGAPLSTRRKILSSPKGELGMAATRLRPRTTPQPLVA